MKHEISETGIRMLKFQEQLADEYKYKPIPRTFFKDVRAEFEETLPEWCNMSGDTTKLETRSGTVMGSSDTIVYAHWTAYTITINYHNDGAQTWHSYCANAVNSCTNLDIVESESTAYDTAYTHTEYGILDVGRFTKARYKASNRWKVGSKDSSVMVVDTNWSEELAASATGKNRGKISRRGCSA